MKSCIYIGMASDDVDISELVETIAVTAREIEENSRVCKTNECFMFHVFSKVCDTTLGNVCSFYSFLNVAFLRARSCARHQES